MVSCIIQHVWSSGCDPKQSILLKYPRHLETYIIGVQCFRWVSHKLVCDGNYQLEDGTGTKPTVNWIDYLRHRDIRITQPPWPALMTQVYWVPSNQEMEKFSKTGPLKVNLCPGRSWLQKLSWWCPTIVTIWSANLMQYNQRLGLSGLSNVYMDGSQHWAGHHEKSGSGDIGMEGWKTNECDRYMRQELHGDAHWPLLPLSRLPSPMIY